MDTVLPVGHSTISHGRFQVAFAIPIVGFHLALVAAPFTFQWDAVFVAIILWALNGFGVTLGFHRLLTHGAFQTYRGIRYALTILGCLANEVTPLIWVGTHRLHHQLADKDGDPHSPTKSIVWAHVQWLFFFEHEDARRMARDLAKDPMMRLIDRFHWVPQVVLGVTLYVLGGWPWVVWGIFVRTVFTWHCTWLVNSAGHLWGYRSFNTPDNSRNSWWLALITFGEGWHNNHHAQPRSAAHGLRWWELDLTYALIRFMEMVGLAWDVEHPRLPGRSRIRTVSQELSS